MRDFRTALAEALSNSADVNRSISRIREEGWSLYLVVDRKSNEGSPDAFELTATTSANGSGKPTFRIDGRDLSFLKSIGIDPTRRSRRR